MELAGSVLWTNRFPTLSRLRGPTATYVYRVEAPEAGTDTVAE